MNSPVLLFSLASLCLLSQHCMFVHSCSNFLMENDFQISVRTMDLGTPLSFGVRTYPSGSEIAHNNLHAVHSFVGFPPHELEVVLEHFVSGGLNDKGLSCDQQTLIHSVYPNATGKSTDLGVDYFCEYLLGMCATVSDVMGVLENGTITPHGPSIAGGDHFVLRDATGASVVVEFLNGETVTTIDLNDGKTGFGIMTNEPEIDFHITNTKHAKWKLKNARPSFTIPGAFYPDERFLRIHLLKSVMPTPTSYEDAIMQAVHVLNSVTVPMGNQMGTDSSKGEGAGDHTLFGVVYDHINMTIYWRTETNQNLQRLRLQDVKLSTGSKAAFVPFQNKLPWFSDAASAFSPSE